MKIMTPTPEQEAVFAEMSEIRRKVDAGEMTVEAGNARYDEMGVGCLPPLGHRGLITRPLK